MSSEKDEAGLPDRVPANARDRENVNALYVENFHYSPNSISELRRLAESNPELAEKIVDSQDRVARLYSISEWIGMVVSAVLGLSIIAGFVSMVVNLGWWQSLAFVLLMLATSHLLRTVLTGEWSETSWLGPIFKASGFPKSDDSEGDP
ncbi:hypothetical protein [Actibacterium ureilyticum]|uniref:hypothetical protein n=1 Tax=Actibacterium ureilyticum TaxID=1590614 RepID=UPI001140E64C|nr:hypothetical protein [Actibacterium ureilyticum]